MTIKKRLTSLALSTALALGIAGCSNNPVINKNDRISDISHKDMTGDGIPDVLIRKSRTNPRTWLFVGKKEGGYLRGREYGDNHFRMDDGSSYFFDGKF